MTGDRTLMRSLEPIIKYMLAQKERQAEERRQQEIDRQRRIHAAVCGRVAWPQCEGCG